MNKAKLEKLRRHINRFFAKYPKFTHDPTKSYTEEFLRMASEFGWSEGSKKYKIARKKLNTASVLQFNENFDKDFDKDFYQGSEKENQKKEKERKMLRKWIVLFNKIDIKDLVMPKTVAEFEERVKSVHTNICDVLEVGDQEGISSGTPTCRYFVEAPAATHLVSVADPWIRAKSSNPERKLG
ncbi:unnamed protein product [Rhizoctonia solani]|uniref:Uncharacterized protein n=1 Tax=Rhizoctonia solani TaxID=456999 RepID=A0A8H3H7L1_9AGAM|nr:unnamed protein product [Rhizoctonia solani]